MISGTTTNPTLTPNPTRNLTTLRDCIASNSTTVSSNTIAHPTIQLIN